MLQTIGLIIAVYCLCRLWQVPFELAAICGINLRITDQVKWFAVLVSSLLGMAAIAILTFILLFSGVEIPRS